MSTQATAHRAIVIGCSAGGIAALRQLLAGLAPGLQAPITIVCHTGSEDITVLIETLASSSRLPVLEACERQLAERGSIYLAPGGYHLLVESDRRYALSVDARVCHSRPSIDVLFETAAACHREALIGVILTGGNADGAQGLKAIRQRGGLAIVQSPDEAEVTTMPLAALRVAGADHIAGLQQITALLNHHCHP